MVKRAVGTRACLLGKAVTCNYLRQDNFLEVIEYYKTLALFNTLGICIYLLHIPLDPVAEVKFKVNLQKNA